MSHQNFLRYFRPKNEKRTRHRGKIRRHETPQKTRKRGIETTQISEKNANRARHHSKNLMLVFIRARDQRGENCIFRRDIPQKMRHLTKSIKKVSKINIKNSKTDDTFR